MTSQPIGEGTAMLERRLGDEPDLSLTRTEALAPRTTLRIGGPAELLARVRSESALIRLLDGIGELELPWRILGLGSNVLIPDEGLAGVTVVMEGEFLEISFSGPLVEAGAALPLARVARAAVERGWTGLEALSGFPSTVGGAVIMNAGCYGVEVRDVLQCTRIVRPGGHRETLEVSDLQPSYRKTNLLGSDAVVTSATFHLRKDEEGNAQQRLTSLNQRRRSSMPWGKPNAGSIFKNPPGDYAGRLIEECGLKGERQGGAEISSVHANVIVNRGQATAEDVLGLMNRMRREVERVFQIRLERELILLGSLEDRWPPSA